MDDFNEANLKRLLKLKKHSRDHDINLKLELFIRAQKLQNVCEACRRQGFGRTFYYKWWKRFKKSGMKLSSLQEKSRRPKHSPKKTSRKVEARILELRQAQYGGLMIHAILGREGVKVSTQTVCWIMNGRKRVPKGPRQRLKAHNKRYELPIPGQRVQVDVKYVPQMVAGMRAFTYVAVDECTRWRFARSYVSLDAGTTLLFLDELKRNCPFPIFCIQTDNGQEFTYKLNPVMAGHVHPMDDWCAERNIAHRLIPPGVKEHNGKVERSHRMDEQYFYWKATDKCLRTFNEQLDAWLENYNRHRPHGGLGFLTPVEKLQERLSALGKEDLAKEMDWMRRQFLMEAPVKVLSKYGTYRVKSAA